MSDLSNFFPLFDESEEEIRARLDALINAGLSPTDSSWVDTRQGGFYWDISQLLLLEFARLWDVLGTEVPAASSPLTAWGTYLDNHAAVFGLTRKDPVKAFGAVVITGDVGSLIPNQFEMSAVPTVPDVEAPEYVTTESGTIPSDLAPPATPTLTPDTVGGSLTTATYYYKVTAINDVGETLPSSEASSAVTGPTGKVTVDWADIAGATGYRVYRSTSAGTEKFIKEVTASTWIDTGATAPTVINPPGLNTTGGAVLLDVEAKESGSAGNVAPDAVTNILTPVDGVLSVTNPLAITGGEDDETDEALRDRLLLEYKGGGPGNIADHERWALAFEGVGRVTVFPVYQAIAGQVGIALMTSDGDPVAQTLIDAYQDYIDPVLGQGEGQAPIGQSVIVFTPTQTAIDIVATVTFESGYGLDSADGVALRDAITQALKNYVDMLDVGADVIFNHVRAQFFTVTGVHDVTSLTVEGGSANVSIDDAHVSVFGSATLS